MWWKLHFTPDERLRGMIMKTMEDLLSRINFCSNVIPYEGCMAESHVISGDCGPEGSVDKSEDRIMGDCQIPSHQ